MVAVQTASVTLGFVSSVIVLYLYLIIAGKQRSHNFIMNSGDKVISVPLKDTLKHYTLHFMAGEIVSVRITCSADLCVFWGLQLPSAFTQLKSLRDPPFCQEYDTFLV